MMGMKRMRFMLIKANLGFIFSGYQLPSHYLSDQLMIIIKGHFNESIGEKYRRNDLNRLSHLMYF